MTSREPSWWEITAGGCKTAYGGDLDDVTRYWYFYAHASDGAHGRAVLGDGPTHCVRLVGEHGEHGQPLGRDARGDINGHDNYTVNLIPWRDPAATVWWPVW